MEQRRGVWPLFDSVLEGFGRPEAPLHRVAWRARSLPYGGLILTGVGVARTFAPLTAVEEVSGAGEGTRIVPVVRKVTARASAYYIGQGCHETRIESDGCGR